jgi:hypothetical protein
MVSFDDVVCRVQGLATSADLSQQSEVGLFTRRSISPLEAYLNTADKLHSESSRAPHVQKGFRAQSFRTSLQSRFDVSRTLGRETFSVAFGSGISESRDYDWSADGDSAR